MDFTIATYNKLLDALLSQGFSFQTFAEFIDKPEERGIVLRHDVDKLQVNSLVFARIQAEKGIRGTYYFRILPGSFDERIIKEICSLGHEIGYHYEDVSISAQRHNGITAQRQMTEKGRTTHDSRRTKEELAEIAIESFKTNLEKLRQIVPVKTICMHGSPISRWDSRLLWKYYDYHNYGITGEPYFDIDFDKVLYLTDTGRCWDGDSFNIRDKILGYSDSVSNPAPQAAHRIPLPKFHTTSDIIKAAEEGRLPEKIMLTFHPQRWTDNPVPWVRELVWQNMKNVGKYFLVKVRSK